MGCTCSTDEELLGENRSLLIEPVTQEEDVGTRSSESSFRSRTSSKFKSMVIKCNKLEDVQNSAKKCGVKTAKLIIGIDYSESNKINGISLHETRHTITSNPYQEIIETVGRTFSAFEITSEENPYLIHVFGFGDMSTKDKSVFPFFLSRSLTSRPCKGTEEVLKRYLETTRNIIFSKPTSFGPLIRESIKIVQETHAFHVLLIISPGQIENTSETKAALNEASKVPMSVVTVGVGEGPWTQMYELYEEDTSQRVFENFHFVPFADAAQKTPLREVALSSLVLQEIPAQLSAMRRLGYKYK